MSEAADIRVWAKAHGVELGEVGRIPGAVRERYRAEQNGDPGDDGDLEEIEIGEDDLMPPGDPEPVSEPPAPPVEGKVAERRPQPQRRPRRRPKLLQRDQPKPKKTKPARARVSIESVVSGGWSLAAFFTSQRPALVPVARVLDMQAPAAGIIVEDAAKGTVVDRILQPLARMGEKGRVVGSLVGLPAAVALVTAQPELYPVAKPVMRLMLMGYLEAAGPAMKKAQERARKLNEGLEGLDIDAMLDSLWAGIPTAGEPSPHEEDNIRRARGE